MNSHWTTSLVVAFGSAMAYFVHRTGGLKEDESVYNPRHSWKNIVSLRLFTQSLGLDLDLSSLIRFWNILRLKSIEDDMPALEPCEDDNRLLVDKQQEGLLCFGDLSMNHIDIPSTPTKNDEQSLAFSQVLPLWQSRTPPRRDSPGLARSILSISKPRQRRSLSGGSGEMFFGLLSLYAQEHTPVPARTRSDGLSPSPSRRNSTGPAHGPVAVPNDASLPLSSSQDSSAAPLATPRPRTRRSLSVSHASAALMRSPASTRRVSSRRTPFASQSSQSRSGLGDMWRQTSAQPITAKERLELFNAQFCAAKALLED